MSVDASAPANGEHDALEMPGHLLRRCQQIAVAIFLNECRNLDLTPMQFGVLQTLNLYGAMDQVSLGGLTALDRTTIQVLLHNLEERELVTRSQSSVDKRSKIVRITRAGSDLVDEAMPFALRAQERMVAPLTKRERETLMRLLAKMAEENNLESRAPFRKP